MLQFLKDTKFNNLSLEFCRSMQRRRCFGMSPKRATRQWSSVSEQCLFKMATEDLRSD